jgi:hypothetical protein
MMRSRYCEPTQYSYPRRRPFLGPLIATIFAVVAAVVLVVAAVAALGAIVTAVVAYVKREEWTLPAYRWTRDKTGQWRVTPWSSQSDVRVAPGADSDLG